MRTFSLAWRNKTLHLPKGTIMGVINATPDSFSDGGDFVDVAFALLAATRMAQAGAGFLDVGGESTRPGAQTVPVALEIERVVPVVTAIKKAGLDVLVSVDTRKPEVAHAALKAGADLVNDVTALHNPAMREVCADAGVPAMLMHMRGTPETLAYSSEAAPFEDVVREVRDELHAAARLALQAGVPSVLLDPGFGFGKSVAQNLELVRGLPALCALGFPVVLGASRKSTLGQIAGVPNPKERDAASIAAHLFALMRGADVLRVHDVAGHVQAVRVWHALEALGLAHPDEQTR